MKSLIKDLERNCSRNLGWIRSILKSRLFGYGNDTSDKNLIETLEEQIILADTQLCSAILEGISQDISGYLSLKINSLMMVLKTALFSRIVKAGWLIRKAWKVYDTTYRQIYELYNRTMSCDPLLQGIRIKLIVVNEDILAILFDNLLPIA